MSLPAVPASLPRSISTFIARSKELATADPIISYFCRLFAVEQILTKSLHTTDDEIAGFAMGLLDNIESFKKDSSAEILEVIQDKESSIAYVLNFANKIFATGLMAIQEQRVSKQTAMSLLASANFFELLQLWKEDVERVEELEDVSKKSKYAKFHAARILKAYKNGEDPNEYVPPRNEFEPTEESTDAVSSQTENKDEEEIPVVEPEGSNSDNFGLPSVPTTISQSTSPQGPPQFIDDEPEPPKESLEESTPFSLPEPPKSFPVDSTDDLTLPETPKSEPCTVSQPTTQPVKKVEKKIDINEIMESSEVYSKAQKHAKFAISAMNYEDKATAVKELEQALELLAKLRE